MGCYINKLFIACVLYADDVCLLAPSRKSMQELLDVCSNYASSLCITYDERKTKLMYRRRRNVKRAQNVKIRNNSFSWFKMFGMDCRNTGGFEGQ